MRLEAWIASVFDHPGEGPEWYWDPSAEEPDLAPAERVALLAALFADPARHLAPYSDAQLARGLWYVASNALSSYALALLDPSVQLRDRAACIAAIPKLFAEVFAPRCLPELSHAATTATNPLNTTCFMWWDIFPTWGGTDADDAILAAIAATLEIPSLACQEAALHGLGHWHGEDPAGVEALVDAFLRRADVPEALRAYAESARSGCVQ